MSVTGGGGYGLVLQRGGWVGVKFMVKKRYVTLEWPLSSIDVRVIALIL